MSLYDRAQEAVDVVRKHFSDVPEVGIILGTGLSGLVKDIQDPVTIEYTDIPHMPMPTVMTHEGRMVCGRLGDKTVVAFEGRFHAYEGYNGEQVTPGYAIVNGLLTWNAMPSLRLELQASNLFDTGYQNHLAGVNRVNGVDIPAGERLWGAERTISIGAVMTF